MLAPPFVGRLDVALRWFGKYDLKHLTVPGNPIPLTKVAVEYVEILHA